MARPTTLYTALLILATVSPLMAAPKPPIFLPKTQFWYYVFDKDQAMSPDGSKPAEGAASARTGGPGNLAQWYQTLHSLTLAGQPGEAASIRVDLAEFLATERDPLGARATLVPARNYFMSVHDVRGLARCLSLDRLVALDNAGSDFEDGEPDDADQGDVAWPTLESELAAADPSHSVPADLEPWVRLFDAYQRFKLKKLADARNLWLAVADSTGFDPLVRGLAWLAVAQVDSAVDKNDDFGPAFASLTQARQIFQSAGLVEGIAQATMMESSMRYPRGDIGTARQLATEARHGFETKGLWRGALEAELTRASGEMDAGQKETTLQAAAEVEQIRRMHFSSATNGIPWILSTSNVTALIRNLRHAPAFRTSDEESTPAAPVAEARKFAGWARETGNPFIEWRALQALARSLRKEGQWKDAQIYSSEADDLYSRAATRVSFRELVRQAAHLDFVVMTREGIADFNVGDYSGEITSNVALIEARLAGEHAAGDTDDHESQAELKLIAAIKGHAAAADRHRLRAMALVANGQRIQAIKEIGLKYDELSELFNGLSKFRPDPDADADPFDDDDTDDAHDSHFSDNPDLIYAKSLEIAVLSRDESSLSAAVEGLIESIHGGVLSSDRLQLPIVLGGFGSEPLARQSAPGDWQSDIGIELAAIETEVDAAPWLRGVRWGRVLSAVANATLSEELSDDFFGGVENTPVATQEALGADGLLFAMQVAASLGGHQDFVQLPRINAGALVEIFRDNSGARSWAGVMGYTETVKWIVSVKRYPVLRETAALRGKVQWFLSKAMEVADDDLGDDDDTSPGSVKETALRAFKSERWVRDFPVLLLMLSGERRHSEELAVLLQAAQTELDRLKAPKPTIDSERNVRLISAAQHTIEMNLVLYFMSAGRYPEAVRQLRRLSDIGREHQYELQYGLSLCYGRMKMPLQEQRSLGLAVDAVGQLRASMSTLNLALRLRDTRQILMEEYLSRLNLDGKAREMIDVIWKYRHSSLAPAAVLRSAGGGLVSDLETLRDLYEALSVGDLDGPVTPESASRIRKIYGLPEATSAAGDPTLNGINVAVDAVIDEVDFSRGVQGGNVSPPGVVNQTRRPAVEEGDLLIFYFVGTHGLYAVTLDETGKARPYYRVVEYGRLEQLCKTFLEGLAARASRDNTATAIYKLVLDDMPEMAGKRRIRILSDGPLQWIPFQALRKDPGDHYLAERAGIAYLYGKAEGSPQTAKRSAASKVLVVAIPTGDLRSSEEEARSIIVATNSQVPPLLGNAATLEGLKDRLPASDTVHFSTHAIRNANQPNFSFIELASNARIYSYDLANLDVRGKRVFLAACDTLVGETAFGEDTYGLADAFISAGASSVVATLWAIDSEASGRFASTYYGSLQKGIPEQDAVAVTDTQFIQGQAGKEFADPFFWAAFNFLSPLQFAPSGYQAGTKSGTRRR